MKKVIYLLIILPMAVLAQKPLKPNLGKALNSWKGGKLQEAKEMIDVCATDPKLSLDAKTWYYRGLIYASLDTTSNQAFKSLASNSFDVAMEAFSKAEDMNKNSRSDLFYTDEMGFPVPRTQSMAILTGYYLNAGASAYQDDDYPTALVEFGKVQRIEPNDTTAFFYAGFVAQADEQYDLAVQNINQYIKLGGRSKDAYTILISIYGGEKEDKVKALELTREAKKKFPDEKNFALMEIGYLIDLDKTEEAKSGLEAAVKSDPTNKTLHFYLGYVNSKLDNFDAAKKNFEDAMKIDPTYFDAQYYLAQLYLIEADKIKREMNNLGISKADQEKKKQLDNELVARYKSALPYWEKAEQLNPSDADVLDKLSIIYYYLGEDKKAERINKRLKELGID
ncbi:MAG: hypothetical protein KF687_11970 [Cyclobacteriaceae bacterium]|nr:hypothetical protein [Cyclobacteriaceae bacterium]